ncbi:MAG: sulfite exporter TauE/SafE family protein [Myxococcales bacterium]|nr:sulfite exporter TauE/SafE family protein [Myxococcales bacterium]
MSSPFELIASGAFGVASGVLAGFLGIGGGAILPPLLVFALGIEQHRAQGISLAALLPPVGLPAVLAYRKSGVRVSTHSPGCSALGVGSWRFRS